MHPRFTAAIVDLDGTLVDTLGDFVAVLQRMVADLPPPFAAYALHAQQVLPLVGKGTENLIKSVLSLISPEQALAGGAVLYAQAWQSYHGHYEVLNGRYAQVYPGVVQGLGQMQAYGLRMACVTNKPTVFARALLQSKGLDGFFECVFGGDAFERKKPDPMPVLGACRALGSEPNTTLMVGDSSNDALAARAAGCPVVLVTYGYNHGLPVQAVDADAYVDALTQIPWMTWK